MSKNKNRIFLPPIKALKEFSEKYPGIWDILKKVEYAQEELGWADWCYMPIGMTQGALIEFYDDSSTAINDSGIVAGFAGWRRYKDIFKFNEELINELGLSSLDDKLPVEVFDLLPYPYIYIQREDRDGAIIWREDDIDAKRVELRMIALSESGEVITQCIVYLNKGDTLKDSLSKVAKTMESNTKHLKETMEVMEKYTQIYLPLVLYLCAENAEIAQPVSVIGKPKETRIKIKNNPKDEKLGEISFYPVGEQFGIKVRDYKKRFASSYNRSEKAADRSSGATVSPHVRRGHYHHYWAGSEKQKNRRLILKWTAPTFIGLKSAERFEADTVTINVLR